MKAKPTFIDLFCGCGGFSLGLERASFEGITAIDFNKEAVEVFRANLHGIPHVLEKDLTKFGPRQFALRCQAFWQRRHCPNPITNFIKNVGLFDNAYGYITEYY